MKGYTTDLKEMMGHIARYKGIHTPKIVDLRKLLARINGVGNVPLEQTPHFQYLMGNKEPYYNYLEFCNYHAQESLDSFEYVINGENEYLDQKHEHDFIMVDGNLQILDGVHRATRLFHLGIRLAPVLIEMDKAIFDHAGFSIDISTPRELIDEAMSRYIGAYANDFIEWYSPVNLGRHIIFSRTYPTFLERPDSIHDITLGQNKWDFIIDSNMPDLTGKRVCDLGCNIGIMSIGLADKGAKQVVGYDRGLGIVQPNNHQLGDQNVPQQAYMVRNLYEAYYRTRYPQLSFLAQDLMTLDCKNLPFDFFFSCCTLYHLGAQRMEEIIRDISSYIPEVFLQANDGHTGDLGDLSSLRHHIHLLEKYGYNIIKVDDRPGYPHPIIYAKK